VEKASLLLLMVKYWWERGIASYWREIFGSSELQMAFMWTRCILTTPMAKGSINSKMSMSTKRSGKIINRMVMVYIISGMDIHTKEIRIAMNGTIMAFIGIQMVICM
jgi:hypothetical protein